MYKGKKKNWRRCFPIFFVLLLLASSFLPNLVLANEEEKVFDLQTQDAELERKRELQYQEEALQEEDVSLQDEELASILSGLGWEAAPFDSPKENVFTSEEKIESAIINELEEKEVVDIIVRLKNRPNMDEIFATARGKMTREERVKLVKDQLQKYTASSQKGIGTAIASLEKKGKISNIQTLWVINGLSITVDSEALKELQQLDEVEKITLDRVIELPEITAEDSKPRLPEWGLEKIFATQVWGEYGLKGEGIVVGIMDTGVDGTHEALEHNYRGRDGDHQYSWIDLSGNNYATPRDGNGHGTHVAGTAVGGGKGEPIGVAPDAEWIAAKIFTDGGATTVSAIHRAFEWFMAPGGDPSKAPHVVNNSWGNANTYNLEFYDDVQAWVAAGIFPLFAAGNNGSGSQTIGSPGSFPESFAIGATDKNDQIASFSSRGPVFWTDEEGNQVRLVKPDVSAPGHQIYSAWPGVRGEGKYHTISGTSMATPHVTGAIALLLQANLNLSINDVREMLKNTARTEGHMGSLPNDLYGTGIVNIYQAVTEAAYAGQLTGTVTTADGAEVPIHINIPSQGMSEEVTNGSFSLTVREGKHKVRVEAFGYGSVEKDVTIKKGETTEVEWTLAPSIRYEIKGTVVSKGSGEAIPFAYARLKGTPLQTERTDTSGEFQIRKVPEGTYELVITGEGIKGFTKEVEVKGNQDVIIEAEKITSTHSADWATANNNFHRNAVSPYAIDVNALSSGWEYINGSKGQILFSSASATNRYVVFTTDRGWVTTLDQGTGEEVWSIRIGASNRSTPTIVEGTVYLSGGQDGSIYAMDIKNGSVKWSKSIGQPAVYESPLYKDGILFVGSGLVDNPSVYALDANNGQTLWSKSLGGASFFGGTLGDDYLYIGSYDNRTIRALNIEDGTEVWSKQLTQEGFASRPVYQDGNLYVQSTNFGNGAGTLHVLNGTTGEILWQRPGIGDSQAGSPIVYEDLVIVGSSSQPILRAFHKQTGEDVWSNRSVGTTLHNGSVTANGVLFFSGTSGILQALDVYSGTLMKDFTLPDYSTSGIVVLAGNVIVPHRNGLVSFQSHGVLEGMILGRSGEALDAKVSVAETSRKTEALADGSYSFMHQPGEYTLKVASYGKKQITEPIKFVSGYKENRDYVLEDAEAGSLQLILKDERTDAGLSGVQVELKDTPINGVTTNEGSFMIEEIYEGTYTLSLTLNGYKAREEQITIEAGEQTSLEFNMQPFDIAVLNDWDGEVTTLLNRNGFLAEERDWDIIEDINRYEVVYLNGAYGTGGWRPDSKMFLDLIEKAEVHDVSLVFADSWGANYGSIRQLTEFTQDPKEIAHFYGSGQVRVQIDQEHPIFEGYNKGDRLTLFTRTGDFAWFNNYSGRHLASIGSTTQGMMGTGVAYKAVSENSAHLLLANHGASPWISPLQGWLPDMQNIMLNGLRFLLKTDYGEIVGTVVDADGTPVQAEIGIVETNISTRTDGENAAFQMFHDEGEYTLEIRASGYATQIDQVVIQHGTPTEVQIVLGSSNGDRVAGLIKGGITLQPVSGASVKMVQNNEVVAERETAANGRFEFTGLEYGSYTLRVEKEGHIQLSKTIEVGRTQDELSLELYPMPLVAVLGDYSIASRNFQATMNEVGIIATPLTVANVVDEVANFDVLFVNDVTAASFPKNLFESMMEKADDGGTSVIFGDSNGTGAGITHLVRHREDPKQRRTVADQTKSAGYIVKEEHPIFKGKKGEDFVELLLPTGGRIGVFEDYSGYTLASVAHEGNGDAHGLGVAFKPRTGNSVELLLSAHGFGTFRHKDHYTEQGKDFLVDSIVWAAYAKFHTISGVITDKDGMPLVATVSVNGEAFSTKTNPENGEFSIAILDGDYDITIEAFGYDSETIPVQVNANAEPLALDLEVDETVGTIKGMVENEKDGTAVNDVYVEVIGVPRKAVTETPGTFTLERLLPGTYDVVFTKVGFIEKQLAVEIRENEEVEIAVKLRPSPTVGVIVDSTASGTVTMKDYLEGKGYDVIYMHYTDIDKLEEVELVIANSDYDPGKIPSNAEFKAFQQALDETETSVIWTGQHGGRGSIRFLKMYENNPSVEIGGSSAGAQGTVLENHPIVEGVSVNEAFPVTNRSNYHYAFDGYGGVNIADLTNASGGKIGSMIAYNGRTINSVEVLLANFTFSYSYHPGAPEFFDPVRERIFNNAITWTIDNKESIVGEIHGVVKNQQEMQVQATVTVVETGKIVETNQQGEFKLGLPSGNYTLVVDAFGHHSEEFTISVENGQQLDETFILTTDSAGVVTSTVKDGQTETPIEGATVTILATPISGTTDQDGVYETIVPVGTYSIRASAPGYGSVVQHNVIVEDGGQVDLTFLVQNSEKIAVVGTLANGNRIMDLLATRGYDAELHLNNNLQPLLDSLGDFALVIFNEKHSGMTNAQLEGFIEQADNNQVSIIFASQLGGGTIRDLSEATGNPSSVSWGYVNGQIQVNVYHEHPIFAGFTTDEITILTNGNSNQQYAVYEGYSGTTIGSLSHIHAGVLGEGIGYDFRTANSVHLLLSGLQVGTYGQPETRWTEEAKQLYFNAIDWAITASLGEIRGTVTNEEGEGISQATVKIETSGVETTTNALGQYRIGVGTGTYDVKVIARGYEENVQTVEVKELGDEITADFTLVKVDGVSVTASVLNNQSEEPIPNATVMLTALDASGLADDELTNEDGIVQFNDLLEGEYELSIAINGYLSFKQTVTVLDEDVSITLLLDPIEVAVLGDWNSKITSFLNEQELFAESGDWDIVKEMENYKLVVINSNKGSEEQVEALLQAADEHEVSLVFVGTWGPNEGSIQLLQKAAGYPKLDQQGYNKGSVKVQPLEEHPVFEGLTVDDDGYMTIHAEKSPYSTFKEYPGHTIGNIRVDGEDMGAAIAYEFKGKSHMHLLLSSFAVNNMIGTDSGWTEDGKRLFVQALRFAMEAEQEEPEPVVPMAPVWEDKQIRTSDRSVTVKGSADAGSTVHIYEEKGNRITLLESVGTDEDGRFTVVLHYVKNGNHFIMAQTETAAGLSEWSATLQITIIGKPANESPGHPKFPLDLGKPMNLEENDLEHKDFHLIMTELESGVQLQWEDIGAELYEVYRDGVSLMKISETTYFDDLDEANLDKTRNYLVIGYLEGEKAGIGVVDKSVGER